MITISVNQDQLSRLKVKSDRYLSQLHPSAAGRNKTIKINQALKQAQKEKATACYEQVGS